MHESGRDERRVGAGSHLFGVAAAGRAREHLSRVVLVTAEAEIRQQNTPVCVVPVLSDCTVFKS
jgi:hypothetical protein